METFEISVEKLVYGGKGLAFLGGKTVLVSGALPGEKVEAETVRAAKGVVHARALRILEAAPDRRTAPCPYFGRCGGCHYQHIPAALQLDYKKEILRETLRRTGKIDWPGEIRCHTGSEWEYRNRAQFKVSREGEIGFFAADSHSLCAVDSCAILSSKLNKALSALRDSLSGNLLTGCREVEAVANNEDTEVLLTLRGRFEPAAAKKFAEGLLEAVPSVVSVAVESPRRPAVVAGRGGIDYSVGGIRYRVSHGSFFQTSRPLTETLVKVVTEGESGEVALDLYAGVGLLSLSAARRFKTIYAVESQKSAVEDLKNNTVRETANVKVSRAEAAEFLYRYAGAKPDLVILDPPRRGAELEVVDRIAALAPPRITYVSCDPATLARDLRRFLDRGYEIGSLDLVEFFPQTYHIESVTKLKKVG